MLQILRCLLQWLTKPFNLSQDLRRLFLLTLEIFRLFLNLSRLMRRQGALKSDLFSAPSPEKCVVTL